MNNFVVLNLHLKFTEQEDEELSLFQIDKKNLSMNIAAQEFYEKIYIK